MQQCLCSSVIPTALKHSCSIWDEGSTTHRMPAAAEGLKRVALTLPPPARLEGAGAQSELPKATQAALGKLLHACGLATEFDGAPSPNTPTLRLAWRQA